VGAAGTILVTANGTSWAAQTSGTANALNEVDFVDSTHGWAVGAAGTIRVTTNGTSWGAQASGTANALNGVSFVDATHGWAVGAAGTILVTANGTSWGAQTSGTANALNDVFALDTSHVWAVGAAGTIRVYDGASWSGQAAGNTDNVESVVFRSSSTGWIAEDNNNAVQDLMLTQDGGTNWITLSPQNLDFRFTPTVESGTAVTTVRAVLAYKASVAPGAAVSFWLLASTDGGTTWKYFPLTAATTTLQTVTIDLSSFVDTVAKVSNLAVRFYVEAPSTFLTRHDFIQVQVN
jgi:photosystem II stability/assembly factor-like uncharacterized protein